MKPPNDEYHTVSSDAIRVELERVLSSPDFQASQRLGNFLRFVVEEKLSGRGQLLKGYTIATSVFGRGKDFDADLDPIVRIEAGKLRRALELYYLKTGSGDSVRIEIPKGTYVPRFIAQTGSDSNTSLTGEEVVPLRFEGSWPSVLIKPFKNLTGDPELNYLGGGLATELAVDLARYQEIRVLIYDPERQSEQGAKNPSRFVIVGSIMQDVQGIKFTVQLLDTTTDTQVWGDVYRSAFEAAQLIAFQEEVAHVIAVKVAGEQGIIARALSGESRNLPPKDLKTYEAILQYYEYDMTFSPESFLRALEALEHAVSTEPECGQTWTMLGRLYANIYSLDYPGFEKPLEKAKSYAERGVQLNPDNQRARSVLALVRMFSNDLSAAQEEIERAYVLNPNSLFILDGIGYIMTLIGEWERGTTLIRKVMDLNPYYKPVVHYALWLDWIRQGEYENAYLETFNFRRPLIFWSPLAKAAICGLLGKNEEGKKAVQDLLELNPEFKSRGRALIERYIKFNDIVERVIHGLNSVGLDVET